MGLLIPFKVHPHAVAAGIGIYFDNFFIHTFISIFVSLFMFHVNLFLHYLRH